MGARRGVNLHSGVWLVVVTGTSVCLLCPSAGSVPDTELMPNRSVLSE